MDARKLQVDNLDVSVVAEPLTHDAFAPFGDVVCNPRPDVVPATYAHHAATAASPSPPHDAVLANQGHAIQYRNVSRIRNLYHKAPSAAAAASSPSSPESCSCPKSQAEPIMSMFVCAARPLLRSSALAGGYGEFAVQYLERHPFTTQTFSPVESTAARYLVIVAPSLPPSSSSSGGSENDDDDDDDGGGVRRSLEAGSGPPDVERMRAFVATRAQAVTYAAGTWHAPMVVLGRQGETLDFVVSQFASGVAEEDCQLVELVARGGGEVRVVVLVPGSMRGNL